MTTANTTQPIWADCKRATQSLLLRSARFASLPIQVLREKKSEKRVLRVGVRQTSATHPLAIVSQSRLGQKEEEDEEDEEEEREGRQASK